METIERSVAALDASRQQDKQAIVSELSNKVADLMTSQPSGRRTANGYEHVVRVGETLSEIATAYGVRVEAIVEFNKLRNPNTIRVGQTLFIPE